MQWPVNTYKDVLIYDGISHFVDDYEIDMRHHLYWLSCVKLPHSSGCFLTLNALAYSQSLQLLNDFPNHAGHYLCGDKVLFDLISYMYLISEVKHKTFK